ncbi:MAG: FAD-binding oxidoreductase [Pyrinomonadaceae bacterium]|nr:FAD-binding oxidoreductase [Pyrinomonadaceae bacterium]
MMLSKSDPDEIQSFMSDASYLPGGFASRVMFPDSAAQVTEVLATATREGTPVTVSGAGTGTVAGRVPFGGYVLATDRLNQIKSIVKEEGGGRAVVGAGVRLADFQRLLETKALLYPPDPTERSCFIGGNIATNASGARTFKYGPTRNYVERLTLALATGDIVDLRRGELRADAAGRIEIPLESGRTIEARLPSYLMPQVRKHASGYYVEPGMDVLDLFIGSEGTLGVVVEAELRLLPKPQGILSGVIFFASNESLLGFVAEARSASLKTRQREPTTVESSSTSIDARALEYFDSESLSFLKQKYEAVPAGSVGALFFEQETTSETEELLMTEWLALLERHQAMADESWFATTEQDQEKLREFRHQLPVLMNEWFARYKQRKVSTDMAVPDEEFHGMMSFYENTLQASGLKHTIFGHIGDNHVHVNILPRDDAEAARAREIYMQFVRRAVKVGGTVSAEHGIGKLKREYLREMYGEEHLREMAALKRAFDPGGILGRGNLFQEELL